MSGRLMSVCWLLLLALTADSAWSSQGPCNVDVIQPANPSLTDRFGLGLSARGDLLAVGAPFDSTVAPSAGAVYLYRRLQNSWSLEDVVRTQDLTSQQYFGVTVLVGPGFVLASCERSDSSIIPGGGSSIVVLEQVGGAWTEVQRLDGAGLSTSQNDGLGRAMVLLEDGETLIASAPVSYLAEFRRSPSGTWILDHHVPNVSVPPSLLPPGNGVINVQRMKLDGDRIVTSTGTEAALIWQRGPAEWQAVESVWSPIPGAFEFGDVDLDGSWLSVGAPLLGGGAGGVLLFQDTGNGWQLAQTLTVPGGVPNDGLGASLSLSDGRLIAGASLQDAGLLNTGALHVYDLDPVSGLWNWTQQLDLPAPVAAAVLGARDLGVRAGRVLVGAPGTPGLAAGSVLEFQLPTPFGHALEGALPNSTGSPAVLKALGSPVADHGCLTLEVSRLPVGQFGYFVMGQAQDSVPLFAGSQGHLSLGLPFQRFANDIQNSGLDGRVSFDPDFLSLPQGVQFQPGETWTFQYWTRDAAPMPTSNTSNALALTFESSAAPTLQWPDSVVRRDEATALHTFTLTLSQPVTHDVEVEYVTGGTATHLVDWRVEAASPLVIPAFATEIEIPIVIADDLLQEGDETATVTLVNPSGADLGTLPTLTIRIADDD